MPEHDKTAYRRKIRDRILTILSPTEPTTRAEISAKVGVSCKTLDLVLRDMVRAGLVVQISEACPNLYFKAHKEIRINIRFHAREVVK